MADSKPEMKEQRSRFSRREFLRRVGKIGGGLAAGKLAEVGILAGGAVLYAGCSTDKSPAKPESAFEPVRIPSVEPSLEAPSELSEV